MLVAPLGLKVYQVSHPIPGLFFFFFFFFIFTVLHLICPFSLVSLIMKYYVDIPDILNICNNFVSSFFK